MLVLAFLLAVGEGFKHFLYFYTKTDFLKMFQFGAKIGPRSEGQKENMVNIQRRMANIRGEVMIRVSYQVLHLVIGLAERLNNKSRRCQRMGTLGRPALILIFFRGRFGRVERASSISGIYCSFSFLWSRVSGLMPF